MTRKSLYLWAAASAAFIGLAVVMTVVISHMIRTDPKKAMLVHGKMPVMVASAKITTIQDIIGASCQTQELEKIVINAKVSQPVSGVKVIIGQKVRKGQALVLFDQRVLNASLQEAEDNLEKTRVNLDYNRLNYERYSNLYNQKLIAKADFEKAEETMKDSQWAYAGAVTQIEKTRQDIDYSVVKSPADGIVLERSINPGEISKIDTPVMTIGITDHILMAAHVPEEKIAYVHQGQEAEVILSSFFNEIFKGRITEIDPNTDPKTRTFLTYIKVPNSSRKLTPGLTGFARIKNLKTSLAVPSISVVNPVGEAATVFVVDSKSTARIRSVKTGISAGGLTEITGGLKEGEQVVSAGIQYLKDGDRLEIAGDKQ